MANALAIVIHASAAETVTGASAIVDLGETRSCVKLVLAVTEVAGTAPTIAVKVWTATEAAGPWRTVGQFPTVAAAGKSETTIAGLDQMVYASWTITGSMMPSVTFSLGGQAHTLYAGPSDLTKTAIPSTAIGTVADAVLVECCLRASADGETALNSAYELPITGWGEDLRGHCAARAVFYAMCNRGFDPNNNGDALIVKNGGFAVSEREKSAAQSFFDQVASGGIKPIGIVDQTPDVFEASEAVVSSEARRGW